jgi:hypothetical protein
VDSESLAPLMARGLFLKVIDILIPALASISAINLLEYG